MEFKEIQFKDSNTQRVYNNYIKNIKNVTKPLSKIDSQEILMEFNSHIYESMQSKKSKSELDTLLNAIDKLGSPEEILKPLIADKMMDKATKSFNPLHILQALTLNITNGISYIIFAVLYLFLGSFIFLIFAKIFKGNQIGMFFKDGSFKLLGLTSNTNGYEEVLGNWFITVMLLTTAVLYFIITLLLKLKRTINKK